MKEFIIKRRHLLFAILFATVAFLMLIPFWDQPWFVSDEEEIFMHGQSIADGALLYRDTASQHMPLMYYISALFSLVGVNTITGFRLCFYALAAAIWGLMYFRYAKGRGPLTICLYPLLYVLLVAHMQNNTSCILSDQFQGIGMVILLLEFWEFSETKQLSVGSCCMISFAIFLSFGSAFVSAFAIAIMALSVLVLDIYTRIKEGLRFTEIMAHLGRSYWKLLVIVLLPFAVLMLYYLFTGTLDDFFSWAYVLNRKVYPKYLDGGYGSSVITGFFGGVIHLIKVFRFEASWALNLTRILILLLAALWFVRFARAGKGAVIRTGGALLFLIACATREVFHFHGLPAVAVLCLMSADTIARAINRLIAHIRERDKLRLALNATTLVLVAALLLFPYGGIFYKLFTVDPSSDMEKSPGAQCLDLLTEDGERVGFSTLNCEVMVLANVRPASIQGGSVPWFWEYGRVQAMQELTADPPRVFLFDLETSVWGYRIVDYAPELVEFIMSGYTSLQEYGHRTVWVRNDYYAEAIQRLQPLAPVA